MATLAMAMGVPAAAAQTGTITGRVVDSATGRPVGSAQIELRRAVDVAARTTTGSDGRFALPRVDAGTYEISAKAIGYARAGAANISVESNAVTTIAISLSPFGVLLNPEVVSVSRTLERTVDAPASVAVVTAQEIEERPAATVVEHTRDAPGVDFATTGIIQSHIVTRGFNGVFSGALLMLTDNRFDFLPSLRINTPWLLPTVGADVDRIEIVLGPASALYGPNATAGVVQIFTKSPRDWPGTTMSVAGFARGGNASGRSATGRQLALRHAGMLGERFGYKVTGQYFSGTDWPELDSTEVRERRAVIAGGQDERTVRIGKREFAVERWTAEARADYRLNDWAELSMAAGRARAGSAIELTGVGAVQARGWTYDYYQTRLTAGDWFAQAFVNVNDAGGTYLLRTGNPVADRSRMLVTQVQRTTTIGARHDLVYGVDGQRTDPRTEGTQNGRNENDDAINEAGGYVQSETHVTPRFDVVLAARGDYNNRLPAGVFSPRAAIVFKPGDAHRVRLSFNRAFETPTVDNLFLDLIVSSLSPAPMFVRAVGVPGDGLRFRRDCGGGLCMRAPADPTTPMPIDATLVWPWLVRALGVTGNTELNAVPAPSAADVRSTLRLLTIDEDGANPRFEPVSAAMVRDIPPLRERAVSTIEAGYKGVFGQAFRLAFDVYYERRNNFVPPPAVATPSVFFEAGQVGEAGTLANYLAKYLSAPRAQELAVYVGGIAGSTSALGFPIATVAPEGALGGSTDVLLTFRNAGSLRRWGADVAAQWLPTEQWTFTSAVSWTNKDLFLARETDGASDLALNAPRERVSFGVQHRDRRRGLTTYLRGRYVAGFPMRGGVYSGNVPSHNTLDGGVAYRVPSHERMLMNVSAQNLFGRLHREFVGAPMLGRLVSVQMQYSTR